jgi:hypothetical protein
VVRGKDRWLFLDIDTNDIMRQQRGELLLTPDQLDQWRDVLETRTEWLRSHGAAYYFLVPPNPHSVYPEKLPFEIPPGRHRPVTQLIQHLEGVSSPVKVVYPIDRLIDHRETRIYTETNTHWTDLGAFVGYEALMDSLDGTCGDRRLTLADIEFQEVTFAGDLGAKLMPPQESVHVLGRPIDSRARITLDNRVITTGQRIDYECEAAGDTTCLVLGDSFTHSMLPLLAESFGRTVFAYILTLDRELVASVSPDIVVSVMNERFLIRVPDDADGKTLDQWIKVKRADGAVFPPRTLGGTRVDAPLPVQVNAPGKNRSSLKF